jgi:hypothetical protein
MPVVRDELEPSSRKDEPSGVSGHAVIIWRVHAVGSGEQRNVRPSR